MNTELSTQRRPDGILPSSSSKQGNVELLTQAVFKESQEEAQDLMDKAESQVTLIRERGEQHAATERETRLQRAQQNTAELKRNTIAAAHLEAQKLKLKRREQLLNQVFTKVREELEGEQPAISTWETYPAIAERLLREAIVHIRGQHEEVLYVRMDPHTQEILTTHVLQTISKELKIQLQPGIPLDIGTGVIIETSDRHRRYNNTVQARLTRMQNNLRATVYQILIGNVE